MKNYRRWNFEMCDGEIVGCDGTHLKHEYCVHDPLSNDQLFEIIESLQCKIDFSELEETLRDLIEEHGSYTNGVIDLSNFQSDSIQKAMVLIKYQRVR